jgi:exonuclease III
MDSLDKQHQLKKMDMRFGTWNVRSLYRAGSLMTVAKEMSKYKLGLVGEQEVRCDRGGTASAGEYTFFYGNRNGNHELGTGFLIRKRIISAVNKLEFVSDRMLYIILRDCWCDVIILIVHTPTENKIDDKRDNFYNELDCVFDIVPEYYMKNLLGDFIAKKGLGDIFKPTIGSESVDRISNGNGVRIVNFATSKNLIV